MLPVVALLVLALRVLLLLPRLPAALDPPTQLLATRTTVRVAPLLVKTRERPPKWGDSEVRPSPEVVLLVPGLLVLPLLTFVTYGALGVPLVRTLWTRLLPPLLHPWAFAPFLATCFGPTHLLPLLAHLPVILRRLWLGDVPRPLVLMSVQPALLPVLVRALLLLPARLLPPGARFE